MSVKDESESLRIFLVENHPDTLGCFTMYLEQLGHTVISASSFREALEKVPGAHCDMLLSDIGLPDGSGWDLLDSLGENCPPYTVAMSGFGMNSDRQKSQHAGFRHHLVKPMTPSALDRLLEEALQERARIRKN